MINKLLIQSNRWDGWETELDKWETELLKDDKFNVYRTGPHQLFIETNDIWKFSRVKSWLLTRTVSGKTVAVDEKQNEFTSPQELLSTLM